MKLTEYMQKRTEMTNKIWLLTEAIKDPTLSQLEKDHYRKIRAETLEKLKDFEKGTAMYGLLPIPDLDKLDAS